jgi:hypothetical protein
MRNNVNALASEQFDHRPCRAQFKDNGRKIAPASRRTTHGALNRRIIREVVTKEHTVTMSSQPTKAEYEYSYHATKGWRRRRVTQ